MPEMSVAVQSVRTIDVQIEKEGRHTGFVSAEHLPTERVPLAEFVGELFPGHKIEHLHRPDILSLDTYRGRYGVYVKPYSLFFQAVHEAYNQHLPFAIRPEVLAYLILHEIAVVVNAHPDDYRDLFTTSREKVIIMVRDDTLVKGDSCSDWGKTIGLFEGKMREFVPGQLLGNVIPGFSTDTPESRAATLVAFMDAAQSYYDYRVMTLCGLPRIRLDGTSDDYQKLLASAIELSHAFKRHLSMYFEHLIPVLQTIAAQAAGEPIKNDFWKNLYQYNSGSGEPTFSGWITAFLAHTRTDEGQLIPKDERFFDWRQLHDCDGIPIGAVSTHVSSAPFQWSYLGTNYPMRFIGGVLGVEDSEGFVCPQLSYGVLNATT